MRRCMPLFLLGSLCFFTALSPLTARESPVVPDEIPVAGEVDYSRLGTGNPEARVKALASGYRRGSVKTEADLSRLVGNLVGEETDEALKAKLIHDWIALAIEYDATSFFRGKVPDQTALDVLKRGNAVCEGYADLFSRMCSAAGLTARTVAGFARGYGSLATGREDPERQNHAWNAVRIGGGWYLVDATWDSGFLENGAFTRRYSTAFFLLKPEWMIYTHLPSESRYQLLERTVGPAEFADLPFLRGEFFDTVTSGFESLGKTLSVDALYSMRLGVVPGSVHQAMLYDAGSGAFAQYAFTDLDGGACTLFLAPPRGKYLLILFSNKGGILTQIAEFGVVSSLKEGIPAPFVFETFTRPGTRLLSPVMRRLEPGDEISVEIVVPGADMAIAAVGTKPYEMERVGDTGFRACIRVPESGTIDIYASFAGDDRLAGLVSLPVSAPGKN